MELNKNHREALLNELRKATEERELAELCIREAKDNFYKDWRDINLFMVEQKIKLVEKSLIDNEIDY
jgi:hypothetical protein